MSLIDDWCETKEEYHGIIAEGEKALDQLNDLCKDLGYKKDGFLYGSSLEKFFLDNPGAVEAIHDWIEENYEDELDDYLTENCEEDNETEHS